MVTDLSARLPSRLLERCRSRRSLQQKARGTGTEGQGEDPSFSAAGCSPPALWRAQSARPPRAHPPVLAGAAGVARLVGVARVLGLGVHGVRTPRLVALQGHRRGPSGGRPCHLLQDRLLQAKGHLQEVNRHPEGLYLAGQVGLSQRKSSGAPEERKQLVGVGLEQRGRPCPGSSRGSSGEPRSHLRAAPQAPALSSGPVPPALPASKSTPRLCPGVGEDDSKGHPG